MSRVGMAVAMVVLIGLVVYGVARLLASLSCSPRERVVFQEFPQYGYVRKEPEPNADKGSCATYYQTSDSEEQVLDYYSEQLAAKGWEVTPRLNQGAEDHLGGTIVMATRNGFFYEVMYESLERYPEPRPGVHLAVHVSERHGYAEQPNDQR